MLINSPRLTDADRRVWALRELDDLRHARSAKLGRLERRALRVIERFLCDDRPVYVGTSWGKDSVVVAHLARRVSTGLLLVHGTFRQGDAWEDVDGTRIRRAENPHCADVRDAFLARWPMEYREIQRGQERLRNALPRALPGYRRITGIRAEESGVRQMSARTHGLATARVCRPILYWTLADVFGYLAKHDLPVHPSYAMSLGGQLEREGLRVAAIGGHEGRDRGRLEWERIYYGDHIDDPSRGGARGCGPGCPVHGLLGGVEEDEG